MLSADSLRTLFRYAPETGEFFRISDGKPAGHSTSRGYIAVSVLGKRYLAHRLAWLYVHGTWPEGDLDHANQVKSDNRIDNLRLASTSMNIANIGLMSTNEAGAKGVHAVGKHGRYKATIYVGQKKIHLGIHDTLDEAAHAYNKAAIQHFGEFACLNPVGADEKGPIEDRRTPQERASDESRTALVGKVFERLTVVGRGESSSIGEVRWNCRCSCGGEALVSQRNLIKGRTRSCGCLQREVARNVMCKYKAEADNRTSSDKQ